MIPFVSPNRYFRPRRTLKELIKDAGLLGNLALCLDPGDSNSWPGGQTLLDVSGNGRDFTLGAGAAIAADDPTFNGVAGSESSNAYFASDGGDGFQKASANDTFFDGLHKVGWNWTMVALEYFTSTYGCGLVTRSGPANSGAAVGISYYKPMATSRPYLVVGNGSSLLALELITTGAPLVTNAMLMVCIGSKHNSNTNREFVGYVNGTFQYQNFTDSFVPSASAASTQAKFGLTSDGSSFLGVGRQVHGFVMFNKMLSQAEFDALRSSMQRRWPTI